ncbi:hypothetical protein MXMO3_00405 [Maritalea myrionectae]|uniref:Thioredoxin domain-containing protein n=1 Tax=Maritalea myrionectae TaxID=454601 RepID=A0A2R4MA91_9HYPH|nr:deiodinase-like protein [Maritalea myrionectae]AVX02951.1 hypothetical protein MXMO3_00405 [Maritalea myrionectae]
MTNYNYAEFSTGDYDLDNFRGPQIGQKAPDFDLQDVNGAPHRLLDFDGEFLVLELGSITCPLFQGRRKSMKRLKDQFPHIDFKILYVREAHPGKSIGAHRHLEAKQQVANKLRTEDGELRTIVVDGIEGSAHMAYGGYPNAVFIINRHGCVVFNADWNNPEATAKALKLLLKGKPANVKSYFKPVPPPVLARTMGRSGKGSFFDFVKGLPVLIWKNLIRRNMLLALNRRGAVMPDADC